MSFGSLRSRLRRLSWRARPPDPRHRLGRRGERAAAKHLKRRGLRVLVRNYRCDLGEIDLICADGEGLVFVEVKTRSSDERQDPVESLRPAQWRRVENAARYFLTRSSLDDRPCRFDLVTVLWRAGRTPVVEHFPDAYQAQRA